jgi:hypothetical protein
MLIPSSSCILPSSNYNCFVNPLLSSAISEAVLTNHTCSHSSAPKFCYISALPHLITRPLLSLYYAYVVAPESSQSRPGSGVLSPSTNIHIPLLHQHQHTTTPPTSAKLTSGHLDLSFRLLLSPSTEVFSQVRKAASQTSCLQNTMNRPRPVARATTKFTMSPVAVCSHFRCQATLVVWSLT